MSESERPRALVIDAKDNVAVALTPLKSGDKVQGLTLVDAIPAGHKLALVEIPSGGQVVKYAEVIGVATLAIPAGGHVHVHNVVSARLAGPRARP